jgi:hypothetical protein
MPPSNQLHRKYGPIDHLVYAVPSLPEGMSYIKEKTGVEPWYGGRHPGMGTHNAILPVGKRSYLEVIATDPKQEIAGPLWFGMDKITEPRLVTWAVRCADLEERVEQLTQLELLPGPIQEASRRLSNGGIISWRLTDPRPLLMDGVVPFLIDWGTSPHPTDGKKNTVQLTELKGYHPDHEKVNKVLKMLGMGLRVEYAEVPRLALHLDTPNGPVILS